MILRKKIELSSERKIFFASDYHFRHTNVIRFDNRPFENSFEMDIELIKRWNDTVGKDDIVFYLGDFIFSGVNEAIRISQQLNGEIYFIMGNHDKLKVIKECKKFVGIWDYGELTIIKDDMNYHFILQHYPILSWNRAHHGAIHLHGHCHQSLKKQYPEYYTKKVEDVGCNGWDYKPVSFEKIIEIMDKKEIGEHH
jgi:calcineurin-like phosphoesterase family protein